MAFGTAASFTTNTNWQVYTGESTMSYLTQMAGLAYHNFASAAVGIVLAIVVIRGIARKETDKLGNFWVDTTRCLLWVLLPVCLVGSLVLVSEGVVQNLKPYTTVDLIQPYTAQVTGADGKTTTQTITQQVIAQGPVASQEVIKEFGTNGGGFFNANSAHPFENPTPLSNFFEMVLIFAIPSGLTYTLGRMTGSQRHGWAVWAAMAFLFFAGVTTAYWAEARGNPLLAGTDQRASELQSGGNMEGKEVRFGIANSTLFRHGHDRRQLRRGERHARLVHAARRNGSSDQHHAGRSRIWRCRRRPLRHFRFRGSRGVHCRADGRPNSGISGQENRIVRRQDGHARGSDSDVHDPDLFCDLGGQAIRHCGHNQSRAARIIAGALCLRFFDREQWLGIRRDQRKHHVVQHDHGGCSTPRSVLHDHSGARHRRKPGEKEDCSGVRRHISR